MLYDGHSSSEEHGTPAVINPCDNKKEGTDDLASILTRLANLPRLDDLSSSRYCNSCLAIIVASKLLYQVFKSMVPGMTDIGTVPEASLEPPSEQ